MAPQYLDDDLEHLHHRLHKWVEQVARHGYSSCLMGVNCWVPSADVYETGTAYHVFLEIGGVDPSGIEVVVDSGTLHVHGKRTRPQMDPPVRVHQLEIDYGSFRRSFRFPVPVDSERAESHFHHGILEVVLPKSVSGPVRVPLQAE